MNNYEKIQLMRRRCDTIVLSMIGVDQSLNWWNSINNAFDGETPNEMFEKDPERVYNYLVGHIDRYG